MEGQVNISYNYVHTYYVTMLSRISDQSKLNELGQRLFSRISHCTKKYYWQSLLSHKKYIVNIGLWFPLAMFAFCFDFIPYHYQFIVNTHPAYRYGFVIVAGFIAWLISNLLFMHDIFISMYIKLTLSSLNEKLI